MNELDEINLTIERLARANPKAVDREVKSMRQGAKSPAIGRVGHSSEKPLPLPDRVDKTNAKLHGKYKNAIARCASAAAEIERIEAVLLGRLHDCQGVATEEARDLARGERSECSNCAAIVDRLLTGRCRKCHVYAKNHDGEERPRRLIDREIYSAV
jgi:hypothetical protein